MTDWDDMTWTLEAHSGDGRYTVYTLVDQNHPFIARLLAEENEHKDWSIQYRSERDNAHAITMDDPNGNYHSYDKAIAACRRHDDLRRMFAAITGAEV